MIIIEDFNLTVNLGYELWSFQINIFNNDHNSYPKITVKLKSSIMIITHILRLQSN
jgi:hypothetical protein